MTAFKKVDFICQFTLAIPNYAVQYSKHSKIVYQTFVKLIVKLAWCKWDNTK